MAIYLPRYAGQKQGAATVNKSSSLSEGLSGLWVPDGRSFTDISGYNNQPTITGAPTVDYNPSGAIANKLAPSIYYTGGSATPASAGGFTFAAWIKWPSGSLTAYTMIFTRVAGSGTAIEVGRDYFGGSLRKPYIVSAAQAVPTNAVPSDEWHFWVFRADPGVGWSWFTDGVPNGTGGTGVNPTATGNVSIGSRVGSYSGEQSLGEIFTWNRALSDSEIFALSENPWQLLKGGQSLYVGVAAVGPVTHPSTGALIGPGSTVAGTAEHLTLHATTGVLSGPGSSVVGSAARTTIHATTGVLTGQGSSIVGAALHPHTTTGALTGQGSAVTGAASRASTGTHETTGALSGPGAAVVGSATHLTLHTTSGVIVGAGSAIAGTAAHITVHTTTGALTGAGSAVAGVAVHAGPHTTTGGLSGQGSSVVGVAARMGLFRWDVQPQASTIWTDKPDSSTTWTDV